MILKALLGCKKGFRGKADNVIVMWGLTCKGFYGSTLNVVVLWNGIPLSVMP
jgi:hypothetical protein